MRVARSIATALIAVTVLAPGVTAQTDETSFGGGRIEVPEAGYAVTLPDDWVTVRPSSGTVDVILDELRTLAPALVPTVQAALVSGLGFSLLALAADSDPLFTENCNVLDRPASGLTIDAIGAKEMAQLAGLGDALAGEPSLAIEELPAGRVARMELALHLPAYDTASTAWIFSDGVDVHTLTCTDLVRPEDGWRSIAETFEYLDAPA